MEAGLPLQGYLKKWLAVTPAQTGAPKFRGLWMISPRPAQALFSDETAVPHSQERRLFQSILGGFIREARG